MKKARPVSRTGFIINSRSMLLHILDINNLRIKALRTGVSDVNGTANLPGRNSKLRALSVRYDSIRTYIPTEIKRNTLRE